MLKQEIKRLVIKVGGQAIRPGLEAKLGGLRITLELEDK